MLGCTGLSLTGVSHCSSLSVTASSFVQDGALTLRASEEVSDVGGEGEEGQGLQL